MRKFAVLAVLLAMTGQVRAQGYFDYTYMFPATTAGVTAAMQGFQALIAAHLCCGGAAVPQNMIGAPIPGACLTGPDGTQACIKGGQGRAAGSYTDPLTNQTIAVPACGQVGYWYVAWRGTVPSADVPVAVLAQYGIVPAPAADVACVLGTWEAAP